MSFPPATPLRPVPGAFVNTPAVVSRYQTSSHDPVRRTLFSSEAQNPQTAVATTAAAHGTVATTASTAVTAAESNAEGAGLASLTPMPPPRVENMPPVLKAAKAINTFLQSDENFPDLDSYCRRKC